MAITRLRMEHIEEVVALHREVLPTLNAQIGPWLLTKLYELVVQRGVGYVFIEKEEILGFVTYCSDRKNINDHFHLSFKEGLKLAWFFATHTHFIKGLMYQHMFSHYLTEEHPGPFILTLGVSPKAQGKGIGRKLVKAIDVKDLMVDTTSHRAVTFYQKNGFQGVDLFRENVILKRA